MSNTNKVLSRSLLAVRLKLVSPICVSSGNSEYADNDVLRDYDGEAFIPGTTIAGALRDYLEDNQDIFGFIDGEKGKMSAVYISDLRLGKNTKSKIRDFIRVDDYKIVEDGAKFDMEIIEPNSDLDKDLEVNTIFFEIVQFSDNKVIDILGKIKEAVAGIHQGDIRFGCKKNRGFGRMEVVAAYEDTFQMPKDAEKWLLADFRKHYPEKTDVLGDCQKKKTDSHFIKINVPLKLKGGISIREYSAKKGEPDFVQIKSNGKPVIPGNSWNGAIRHQVKKICQDLEMSNEMITKRIDQMFGCVQKKSYSKQSDICINESVLEPLGTKLIEIEMTRNKIDRFDASTENGALYTEKAVFSCKTNLEIQVRKNVNQEWELGLLLLAIKDIQQGYLAIGGQTAIGRGIFEADGELECSELKEQNKWMKAIL